MQTYFHNLLAILFLLAGIEKTFARKAFTGVLELHMGRHLAGPLAVGIILLEISFVFLVDASPFWGKFLMGAFLVGLLAYQFIAKDSGSCSCMGPLDLGLGRKIARCRVVGMTVLFLAGLAAGSSSSPTGTVKMVCASAALSLLSGAYLYKTKSLIQRES